jgi:ParB/RepB/Spo0J family partition protein
MVKSMAHKVPSKAGAESKAGQTLTWSLDKLQPHPRQASLFDDLGGNEFAALVEDIRENGLRQPIEVLPDGCIVCGHQRFRAVQKLAWKNVEVVIRYDLAEAGTGAIERRLIEDNLHRRQLEPLTIARCYQALRQREKQGRRRSPNGQRQDDLRDQIGAHFGRSGRMLDRYIRLLGLPRPIQTAVSQHTLPLSLATKLLKLSCHAQEEIARAITDGTDARIAVRQKFPVVRGNKSKSQTMHKLFGALRSAMKTLPSGPAEKITGAEAAMLRQAVVWLETIFGDQIKR